MSGTFQLVGTIVGSYFGPIGAAVGGSLGGLVDQEVFGKAINGPRLTEFRATGSAVGKPMTRGYGSNRLGGELIWFGRVRERKETKKSGGIGGFGGQKTNTYEYYATFAVGLQEGPDVCLRRIRINGRIWWEDPGYADGNTEYLDQQARLLEFGPSALTADELAQYNATALKVAASQGRGEYFTFYSGESDQAVDPTIANYFGDYAPAYRDLAYVVFKELPVTEYGGALPMIEFETVSGPTQSAQQVQFWVAREMQPWISGADPRNPLNVHEYAFDIGFPFGSFEDAVSDAEAALSTPSIGDLHGWSHRTTEVNPHVSGVATDDAVMLSLHYNNIVPSLGYFGTLPQPAGNPNVGWAQAAFYKALGTYTAASGAFGPTLWWNNVTTPDPVHGITSENGTSGDANYWCGVYYLAEYDPGSPTGPREINVSDLPDVPNPGDEIFSAKVSLDTVLTVRRILSCPPPLCESGDPLPENPDYCVIDGNIYPEVTYSETADGTFLQLAIYEEDSGEVTQYPMGPVLNLDYAPHVANNTQEWWEPFYLAAVAAGTVPAGWTFDETGEGGEGTYPRSVDTVCAAIIETPPYCEAEPVAVADVIEAEATRCKPLVLADLDTSLVTDEIWGIKFETAPTGRDAIEQLRTFSFLDVVDGPQLKFVPRGLPAVATLSYDDLAAHEYGSQRPPALEVTRIDDIQLPKEVRVSYIDKDADLQPGQQYDRRLITDAVNVQTIELGIAMDANDGKRIATVSLYDQWAARKAIQFKLGPRWLMLEPTDCIELPDLDGVTRIRIDQDDLALPGLRTMQGVRDEISLYGRTATGATPQVPDRENAAPEIQGPTTAIVLDLPYMGIGDNDAGYWVAMYGVLDGWQSAEGYRSLDGGTTYDAVVTAGSAIAGTVISPYDGLEITVKVYGGELLSTTTAAAAAGTNRFAIGAPGRWVIGTFETATEDSEGNYVLSDLTMGLFNTSWAIDSSSSPSELLGEAGDYFVMLETASRVSEEDSIVGDTVRFRPVTAGTVFDNGTDQTFIARGNSRGFVTGFGTTTPPDHSTGATYVIGAGATDEWAGFEDYIVHDAENDWFFEFPEDGREVRTTNGNRYAYVEGSGGGWVQIASEVQTASDLADVEQDVTDLQTDVDQAQTDIDALEASIGAAAPYVRGAGWDSATADPLVAADCKEVNVYCPKAGTITKWTILTEGGTGSCVVDVWKRAFASGIPSVANTITAAAKPSVTSGVINQSSTLTGWTTSVAAGDIMTFKLDSSSTFTALNITLEIQG